jgi:DNA-binding response OmpR family regulator
MATRVAVVDDEEIVRELITRVLSSRGYEVSTYEGVTSAYDALYDDPPDLLISDVNMPDGNGLELVSRLRDHHGESAYPVLVLSTLRSESDFIRGYAAGATDYLSKPFSRDELLAKCAVMVSRQRKAGGKPASPPGAVEPALPSEDGRVFGRFEVNRIMGQGTYGVVYDAYDHQQNRAVALKVLSALHGHEPNNRLRFLRESYALSAVSHPNVVRVVDFGVSEGRLYYAMDRVDGVDLKHKIYEGGAASERQVLQLMTGLASALQALADADLIHRDLKPANVILGGGEFARPVLVDFGLAKRSFDRGVTDPLTLMGTPGYIAPEVIMGEEADSRSDLFALGLVGRYALTGEEIFPQLRSYELLHRIAKGPIPIPTCRSERLQNVLRRMVRTDPLRRLESPHALLRALAWVEADPDLSDEPQPPRGDGDLAATRVMRKVG